MDNPDIHIDAWLDGVLDEEGCRQLNEWIVASPENAEYFAERSHIHSSLFDWAKAIGSCGIDDVVDSIAETVTFLPIKIRWQVKAVAAAVVAGLLAIFLLKSEPALVPGDPVAKMGESSGAKLVYLGQAWEADGHVLRSGEYELIEGIASVEYETGVKLLIEAPAEFRMISTELVELSSGRVSAHVPPEGIGFTIETPSAEVVDYGTDFAVEVGRDRSSEIHVFEGEVKVNPREGKTDPVRLLKNDATRIEFETDVPLGIPVDKDRFLRSLDEPVLDYSHVVREMSPVVYYRMGIPKEGSLMKDHGGSADARLVDDVCERLPFAPGRVGSSVKFEGPKISPYVVAADYPKSQGLLSFSAWVRADSWPRWGCIAANERENVLGQFRLGFKRDSGKLQLRVRDDENQEVELVDSETLPLKEWQHIAFVADGKLLRLFRNGREVVATPCGPVSSPRNAEVPKLYVGAQDNRDGKMIHFWQGRIDEVALFNHPLTDSEIIRQYQSVTEK
ncbi:MAG: FecR domain-containing protein [Verrucomicrobiales bacterium]|nr:FecR domain-containing protein [Verrucomicrobiales bacterium]